jgi:prepilin-type processing-associated H-X9-DG protein
MRSEVSLKRLEDGSSNTYMVGEKYLGTDQYESTALSSGNPGFSWGENQDMYAGYEWDNARGAFPLNGTRTSAELYQPSQDQGGVGAASPEVKFGSAHAGGLNMVFCDGSVHVISFDIDAKVHSYLASRLDGNPVTIP